MKWFENSKTGLLLSGFFVGFLVTVALFPAINYAAEAVLPIADAGSSRYAGHNPVVLDGTGSYDPDNSGQLTYAWQQISGPSVIISGAATATPTISGIVQTDEIQECEFELVVSDGELTSLPDTVKVIIVPDCDENLPQLELKNDSFDPTKPTIVYFGGGDGTYGSGLYAWSPFRDPPWKMTAPMDPTWLGKANIIECPSGYNPDSLDTPPRMGTYYRCGDMIIVYLSSVAPNYKQAIQTVGHSGGGQPAMDVGLHLNLTYKDRRYAVNRVTIIDAYSLYRRGPVPYDIILDRFLSSSVDGEQCWIDQYYAINRPLNLYSNVLNVDCPVMGHREVKYWYSASLSSDSMNQFNNGVVAGAYWSVIGPGKNLQLASTGDYTYVFKWPGVLLQEELIELYDESIYPGRLPEPVTLAGPEDGAFVDANGALFGCEHSENAVGYQLLFGPDPHRVMDYYIVSDTPNPPGEIVTASPFEPTWWTVRVYDQYGSTIYADPVCVNFETLALPPIKNLTTGQTYVIVQHAIDDAQHGDEVVVSPGIYVGDINFQCKNLTLRSADPNDPSIVATTIIEGYGSNSVVTFSNGEDTGCVLDGLTITGGTVGISCGDAFPTIRNCTIESTGPIAIEFLYGYEPIIINCTVLGSIVEVPIMEVYDPHLVALWKMDETDGSIAYDSIGVNDGRCHGDPLWQPAGGVLDGALDFDGFDDYVSTPFIISPAGDFSVFTWVKGGAPGHVILSQTDGMNWLGTDLLEGNLMSDLQHSGRYSPLMSDAIITDGQWHRIGFVWDGSHRKLYVDGVVVAKDKNAQNPLKNADGGLYIGASKDLDAGTFFSGLIDDVRIYNKALTAEEIAVLLK